MTRVRVLPLVVAIAGTLLAAGCGPRTADAPPIQRGTALPPPGVTMTPAR